MLEIRRIETNVLPEKFESLGNGIFYYNYDIKSDMVIVEPTEGDSYEETRWNFILVRINGTPTYDKCVTAIVRLYIDQDQEISLISEYASKALDIEDGNLDNYADCLALISEIKYRVKLDFGLVEERDPLKEARRKVLKAIDQYDSSDAVNSFILNNNTVWLDKNTRVGLLNSISIERDSGRSETALWFNGVKLTVRCTLALQMLSILELYALSCYNKTAEHKNNVQKLSTVEDILNYNYKSGYPEKPEFNI